MPWWNHHYQPLKESSVFITVYLLQSHWITCLTCRSFCAAAPRDLSYWISSRVAFVDSSSTNQPRTFKVAHHKECLCIAPCNFQSSGSHDGIVAASLKRNLEFRYVTCEPEVHFFIWWQSFKSLKSYRPTKHSRGIFIFPSWLGWRRPWERYMQSKTCQHHEDTQVRWDRFDYSFQGNT